MSEIETHPVQTNSEECQRGGARVPAVVTRLAYEVYCERWAPQEALITGWCRGGFSVGELVTFLYARSFPKDEWATRCREAEEGMKL